MAEIGRWGGCKFEISSQLIRGFTGLSIKGSSETDDKESGGQKYVSRKNGKPTEISLTISLNALTGCAVRDEAMEFVSMAQAGTKDYFYIGNKKLIPCQLMLTEASVKEVQMASDGKWVRADVSVTMKQCSKNDGSTSSGGSGGGGGSTTTPVKQSVKTESALKKVADTVKTAVTKVATAVKNVLTGKTNVATALTSSAQKAMQQISSIVSKAKTASTAKTGAGAAKAGGGGTSRVMMTLK